MKQRLHYIILALSLSILTPAGIMSLQAQQSDENSSDLAPEIKERPHYTPGGESTSASGSVVKATKTSRDSVLLNMPMGRPAGDASKDVSRKDEDDDVLSFNFLYYIIRKYKLQDIVD